MGSIREPEVENSGITQGKFLTRQRLPTGDGDRLLSWKDSNTAMDLIAYGKVIRLYECDEFTREYLTSEGIEVNPNETAPPDNYLASRMNPLKTYTTPTQLDSFGKFLTLDRVVLRFYAIWDDTDQLYGDK